MIRLHDILDTVSAYNPEADLDLIKKAYIFSAKVHQGQTRRSGEPYLIHPMEVAGILAEMRLDIPSITTALYTIQLRIRLQRLRRSNNFLELRFVI